MRNGRAARAALWLVLSLATLAVTGLAAAAALPTAKSGLTAASAAARKWQPDAVLTGIVTSTAQPDGRAYSWGYIYFSPGAKAKTLFILDENGKIEPVPTFTPGTRPLGEFVDSDAAIGAAIKAGMKTHGFGMKMSLTNVDRAEWFMSDRDYSYTLDAVSGRLLTKERN